MLSKPSLSSSIESPLHNVFWQSLNGHHRHFSTGDARARRYSTGFSPIVGFPQEDQADFHALAELFEIGEQFYCGGWTGTVPDGWTLHADAKMYRMVWQGDASSIDLEADEDTHRRRYPDLVLAPVLAKHAEQAVALARLTNPGPFGLRTIELGDYLAYFKDQTLVAMSGERMHAGQFHEVSGVCTHPDFQGKGLARRLMNIIISRQLARGETPFLHVMSHNHHAHELYLRMGFRDDCETPVRVLSRAR